MRFLLIFLLFIVALNSYSEPTVTYSEELSHAYLPEQVQPSNSNYFVFDPKHLQWAVYNKKGNKVGSGKAIGGKDYCEDTQEPCRTVEGVFRVFRMGDHDCVSNTFPVAENGGAPMPHCMFFYKGYAIHGATTLPDKNTSHGCIRVSIKAAEWMQAYYIKEGAAVMVLPYA